MATHSSILAWKVPRTEYPGGLQSIGSQRVGHNWATEHSTGGSDQNHFKGKEMQEGKVVAWGGFINSWGKKRSKRQGRKEKIYSSDAEFQRIARRDKKAFLNEQCKEIEENNRMGKTRNLFKKIWDIKGLFHASMGTIKDRNVRT